MKKISFKEKLETIAKSFGFIENNYYSANENMFQKNLVCSIRRV